MGTVCGLAAFPAKGEVVVDRVAEGLDELLAGVGFVVDDVVDAENAAV